MLPPTEDFHRLSLLQIEDLYIREINVSLPIDGIYRGIFLKRLHNPGAREWFNLALQVPLFQWAPFGIRFEGYRGSWYFFDPSLSIGEFHMVIGQSRWRNCETIRMIYDNSDLPEFFSSMLYDEVRPLGDGRLLGFGGMNRERNFGDHFYFLLEPV